LPQTQPDTVITEPDAVIAVGAVVQPPPPLTLAAVV
jgi:hypothetical protein